MKWPTRSGCVPLTIRSMRHEAEYLALRLRDAGIPAEVFGDDCGALGLQFSPGMAVYVHENDLEAARELLGEEL